MRLRVGPRAPDSAESSEAHIAVHWREEGYYRRHRSSSARPTPPTRRSVDRFAEDNFPECFKEYADLLQLGQVLGYHAGHEQPAVLALVRRRQAERQLQLCRPAPGENSEQGRADLGSRTRRCRAPPCRSPTKSYYQRVNEFAALFRDFLRPQGRRPGHAAYADGARTARRPCSPAPASGSSTPRSSADSAGRACGHRIADSGSKILITMDAYYRSGEHNRPQGQGRRGAWPPRTREGTGCRQGAGLAPVPRRVRLQDADGRGPRLLRRRRSRRATRARRSSPCPWMPRPRCS